MYTSLVLLSAVAVALGARVNVHDAHRVNFEDARSSGGEHCTGAEGCSEDGLSCLASCDLLLAQPGACKVKQVGAAENGICSVTKDTGSCDVNKRWTCPPDLVCHDGVSCQACPKKLAQTPSCVIEALREAWHFVTYGEGDENLFPGYSRTTAANPDEVNTALNAAMTGLQPIGEASSRSGASFFMTAEKDFLIKGMKRGEEYLNLDKLSSESFDEETTVLNIPVMSYPAFGNYWVVMQNSDVGFQKALGLAPFGDAQLKRKLKFDIKPQPLISKDRPEFFDFARDRLLSDGAQLSGASLSNFHAALRRDLDVLDKYELVDYSWLIYLYQVDHGAVTVPEGTWCFIYTTLAKTGHNNQVAPSFDNVFCFALIDYSLHYDPDGPYFKRAENRIMGGKWTKYADKFVRLTECIFSVPETDEEVKAELQLSKLKTHHVGVRERKLAVMTIETANPYVEAECSDYRVDQCKGVTESVKKTKAGECDAVIKLWDDPSVIPPTHQLQYCKQYLVERCLELLPK